jgi:hypothetical protein
VCALGIVGKPCMSATKVVEFVDLWCKSY